MQIVKTEILHKLIVSPFDHLDSWYSLIYYGKYKSHTSFGCWFHLGCEPQFL